MSRRGRAASSRLRCAAGSVTFQHSRCHQPRQRFQVVLAFFHCAVACNAFFSRKPCLPGRPSMPLRRQCHDAPLVHADASKTTAPFSMAAPLRALVCCFTPATRLRQPPAARRASSLFHFGLSRPPKHYVTPLPFSDAFCLFMVSRRLRRHHCLRLSLRERPAIAGSRH